MDATWYLGGDDTSQVTKDVMYSYERDETKISTGNPTSTTKKIGLIYTSDYGYAAGETCLNTQLLVNFSDDICKNNNWMYKSEHHWWTISSLFNDTTLIWSIRNTGRIGYDEIVNVAVGVYPSLYLSANTILTGEGTEGNPYRIKS